MAVRFPAIAVGLAVPAPFLALAAAVAFPKTRRFVFGKIMGDPALPMDANLIHGYAVFATLLVVDPRNTPILANVGEHFPEKHFSELQVIAHILSPFYPFVIRVSLDS